MEPYRGSFKTTKTMGQIKAREREELQKQETELQESSVKHKGSGVWFKKAEKMATGSPSSSSAASPQGNDITNDLTRGAPTDGVPEAHLHKSPSQQELSRLRSQYYDEAFALRGTYHGPRNRVTQESVVVVKIVTNVIVENLPRTVSDLSCQLALTFQRSEDSIMVIMDHHVCMMFGLNNNASYFVTVSGLPSVVGPVTNLRNTMLIQSAMRDVLEVPENCGVVKFDPIPEENLGINNITVHEEINQLEKKMSAGSDGVMKTLSRSMSRKMRPSPTRVNTAPAGPGLTPSNTVKSMVRNNPPRNNWADSDVHQTLSLPADRLHPTLSAVRESGSESPPGAKKGQEKNRIVKTYNNIKKKIFN